MYAEKGNKTMQLFWKSDFSLTFDLFLLCFPESSYCHNTVTFSSENTFLSLLKLFAYHDH